jgi:hypothetical protein
VVGANVVEVKAAGVRTPDILRIRKAAYDAHETMLANVERLSRAEGRIRLYFQIRGDLAYSISPRVLVKGEPRPLTQDDFELVSRMAEAVSKRMLAEISLLASTRRRFIIDLDPSAPDFDIQFELPD